MSENTVPKGGSKGGTRFPRLSLKEAHTYANKLVSKTHTGAQSAEVVLPGVFGSSTNPGKIKASALKQYGLLDGDSKGYIASELAKTLNSSAPDECELYLRQVIFKPKLFQTLFKTFCNDKINKTRIKQQIIKLNVHPDSSDKCMHIFIESAIYAGLAKDEGEIIEFFKIPKYGNNEDDIDSEIPRDITDIDQNGERLYDEDKTNIENSDNINIENETKENYSSKKLNIELKIDPSMDPEKLEKHLAILKKYGQI